MRAARRQAPQAATLDGTTTAAGASAGTGRGAVRSSWQGDPYTRALATGRGPLFLRRADGWLLPLDVERWCAAPDRADRTVLDRCRGAVLDVGCGPGRLVVALAAAGRRALGIDVNRQAVESTVRAGGLALVRSVFDHLPGEGRWDTVLLLDGNIGIGGDPSRLLARAAALLSPKGVLIAETAPVDVDEQVHVRMDDGRGAGRAPTDFFPWARLGSEALLRHAQQQGWRHASKWDEDGRSFVALQRDGRAGPVR